MYSKYIESRTCPVYRGFTFEKFLFLILMPAYLIVYTYIRMYVYILVCIPPHTKYLLCMYSGTCTIRHPLGNENIAGL